MGRLHNISSRPKTHIRSSSINIAKPTSVFILIGTGNPELGTEYVSIFVSVPSRNVNFLPALRSLHSRLLTKSEPTFNFISAVAKALCLHKSLFVIRDLTTDVLHF